MCYVTHSLRFTSGATHADLLAASMAAEPSLPQTCEGFILMFKKVVKTYMYQPGPVMINRNKLTSSSVNLVS